MKGRQAAKKTAALQRQRETVTLAAEVRKEERRVLLSQGEKMGRREKTTAPEDLAVNRTVRTRKVLPYLGRQNKCTSDIQG